MSTLFHGPTAPHPAHSAYPASAPAEGVRPSARARPLAHPADQAATHERALEGAAPRAARVVAAPAYLARHGRPLRPADLSHHEYLGYTNAGGSTLTFLVDGQWQGVPVRSRLSGNNGEVLVEAAAQGMGMTAHPDFIVDDFIRAGRVEEVLADFPLPELGIYAMLPSNRQVPHRVRVLIDFLAAALAASQGDLPPAALVARMPPEGAGRAGERKKNGRRNPGRNPER